MSKKTKPLPFEFELKESQLHMRLSASLLKAIKHSARQRGIPYTRFVREALEHSIRDDAQQRLKPTPRPT